ncbi:MAG: signal peptidase I [Euryarchaeota archaeon]|nr:signal peptidase I [Euryarchaeota archaeon]
MRAIDLIIISIAAIILITALYIGPPLIKGEFRPLIVLSSSMVPVMQVGDVIVVREINPEDVKVRDIIAFKDPGGKPNTLVTHRVKDIFRGESLSFQTKGDAVEDQDSFIVTAEDVVGGTVFVIPYIGYYIKSSKKPFAFLIFTIIPAIILIADELKKITRTPASSHRAEREAKRQKRRRAVFNVNVFLVIILCSILIFGGFSLFSLNNCSYTKGENSILLKNSGAFSCAYVFKSGEASPFVPPVLLSGNASSIIPVETGAIGGISIITAPGIIPVFWTNKLSEIHPCMPLLSISILPPLLIALLLYPIWYEKRNIQRQRFIKNIKKLRRKIFAGV